MTEQAPNVEPHGDDLPPYFHDPEADDAPREPTRPEPHMEPEEDE